MFGSCAKRNANQGPHLGCRNALNRHDYVGYFYGRVEKVKTVLTPSVNGSVWKPGRCWPILDFMLSLFSSDSLSEGQAARKWQRRLPLRDLTEQADGQLFPGATKRDPMRPLIGDVRSQ